MQYYFLFYTSFLWRDAGKNRQAAGRTSTAEKDGGADGAPMENR